jgi:hypothetical protein
MSELGDFLEALHDAPRATSFSGTARRGQDPEKIRQLLDDMNRRRGGGTHSVAILATSGPGSAPPSGFQEAPIAFWYSAGDWRVDQGASRTIGAGGEVFRFHPGSFAVVTSREEQPVGIFDGFDVYFAPRSLLAQFRFSAVERASFRGRDCWHATTEDVAWPRGPSMSWLHGGESFELWIDRTLGIAIGSEGRVGGELASRFEIDELNVDEPVDPGVFAFVTPDGSPIRTQGEMQLEHLRARGVDVSGIDPADPGQVHDAIRANMGTFGGPADLDQLAAQHVATGPPPDDEEQARTDIGLAFASMGFPTDDGRTLPNVQGGENLGPCAAEVRERFPQYASDPPEIRVEKIKFLDATEAVVWFSSAMLANREGRAVLVEGAWKVSRATYCSLIAMAGVVCPPPPGS